MILAHVDCSIYRIRLLFPGYVFNPIYACYSSIIGLTLCALFVYCMLIFITVKVY